MHLVADAIVLSVRPHGEHGAVVRALTAADGVQPGYVRGARSRALRPVLLPANIVRGEWRARSEAQLAALTVELVETRAGLHGEPLAAAALGWATTLTAAALPEGQPYPRLHAGLSALLDAIAAAPSARGWAAALTRYELLLLAELGFGLDLDRCAASGGNDDLAFVSPRSGAVVSRAAATGYEARLLPLPPFLRDGGEAEWPAVFDALAITGYFIARDIMADRRAVMLDGRERLVDALKRAVA